MSITIYVVNENGELYGNPYKTYQNAVDAVKLKWKEQLDEQFEESGDGTYGCSEVDVPENNTGRMVLYIEKEIYITITKMVLLL
jgi:hypothetical protein